MKIMTFNLKCDSPLYFNNKWGERKHMVYQLMKDYDCDIIGTQEVKNNMLKDLGNNIHSHNIIGRQRCKKASSERNSILISKKHNIHDHKTFWLSESPEKVGSKKWYSLFPRICTTAVVEINNKKIRICNTHLDNFLSSAREFGLNKLMEVIEKEEEKEELPMILMGDFNATPDSKLIKDFMQGKFSKKRLTAVQEIDVDLYNRATRNSFKRTENGVHIDYIFVSEEIEVINAEIINYNIDGKYPSDHYPLISEVKIK